VELIDDQTLVLDETFHNGVLGQIVTNAEEHGNKPAIILRLHQHYADRDFQIVNGEETSQVLMHALGG